MMTLYGILNTEKKTIGFIDGDRQRAKRELTAYHEAYEGNDTKYVLLTFNDAELTALSTIKKHGAIVDKRLQKQKPYMDVACFHDAKVIKKLVERHAIVPDAEFWRLNTNGEKIVDAMAEGGE